MEIISTVFFSYMKCLTSWWWLVIFVTTFISVFVFVFKDDDYKLTTLKALQLYCVGLITLLPWVRKFLSFKLRVDFETRWGLLELNSFSSFTLTTLVFSFFLAPLAFVYVFGMRIYDQYMSTGFAHDIKRHGIRRLIKLKLQSLI